MRIAAYQFAVSGNISENYKEIEKAIYLAKIEDVQLIIFPECSLTGYPPRNITNSLSSPDTIRFDSVLLNSVLFILFLFV